MQKIVITSGVQTGNFSNHGLAVVLFFIVGIFLWINLILWLAIEKDRGDMAIVAFVVPLTFWALVLLML